MTAAEGEDKGGRSGGAEGRMSYASCDDNPLIAPVPHPWMSGAQIPVVHIPSAERAYRQLLDRLFAQYAKRASATSYEPLSQERFAEAKNIVDLVPRIRARRASQLVLGASGIGKSRAPMVGDVRRGNVQLLPKTPAASEDDKPEK